ncbi:MAG: DUF4159 domain-containing protein [Anaerolineaceae bacterium]|nr:DUF4159 domain-containing protein [Anaerolineaceae bacterium]
MSDENLLLLFPQKRIKAYDGMPVTDEIWDQAHAYHRQKYDAHNLFFHGSGILAGLEVVASDPADNIVFILPGVAVDNTGQVIVLSEPVAYDLGNEIDGPLYLFITHRESATGGGRSKKEGDVQYIQDEFLIMARPSLPDSRSVELARFRREKRTSPIQDAAEALHPKVNQIDLRFRRKIDFNPEKSIMSAVVYLGNVGKKSHGRGLTHLAEEIRLVRNFNLVVDDDVKVGPSLLEYSLIYLVGEGKFNLTKAQVNGLQGYIDRGGKMFVEACDEEAVGSFDALISQIGKDVKEISNEHPLLGKPYCFAAAPDGYVKKGVLKTDRGMIFSSYNYGRLWNGECSGHTPSRAEIRTAMEWGTNLIFHVLGV